MTSAADGHANGSVTNRSEPLLPPSLEVERHGADGEVAVLRLTRAAKRNALNDPTVLGIEAFFSAPPVAGVDDELDGVDSAELVARRDAVLNALLAAKTGAGL